MARIVPRTSLEAVVDDVINRLEQAERISVGSNRDELAEQHGGKLVDIGKQLRICKVNVFAIALGDSLYIRTE